MSEEKFTYKLNQVDKLAGLSGFIINVSVLSTGQEAVGYNSSNLSLDNDLCDQLPIRALW